MLKIGKFFLPTSDVSSGQFYSKDVRLPVQLQRAMAAEAEAAREARAKVRDYVSNPWSNFTRWFIEPRLPDFSWNNIPKRENIPNYHKIDQMFMKYNEWLYNKPNIHK
jgi:hypothetical protein